MPRAAGFDSQFKQPAVEEGSAIKVSGTVLIRQIEELPFQRQPLKEQLLKELLLK